MTPEELNAAKYALDERRLRFDRAKAKREHGFLFRNAAVLITAALSLASIVIAVASAINGALLTYSKEITEHYETTRKAKEEVEKTTRELAETERKASFDLLLYITSNFNLIYSKKTDKQTMILSAMESAFPKPALQRVLALLSKTAPTFDGPNVWQKDQREQDVMALSVQPPKVVGDSAVIPIPKTAEEVIDALTGTRRRLIAEHILEHGSNATLDLVISSLLPQSDRWSYRYNLYAAVALAKVPGGWTGTQQQFAAVADLKKSGNYVDPTFKVWVDAATRHYRRSLASQETPSK